MASIGDDAFFGDLLNSKAPARGDAEAEAAVAAAHGTGDDAEVLRLLERTTSRTLCFACLSTQLIQFLRDAILGGPRPVSTVMSLGCGRGMLEWLLSCELRRSAPSISVRSCELEGVAVDFFPEDAVHRVSEAGTSAPGLAPPPLLEGTVLLCAWGETGMLPVYLERFRGDVVVTIGEELFTDPEPRAHIDGWRVHAAADLAGDSTVTVYHRE